MQYPDDFLKNNSVQGRGDKRELDKVDSPYLVRFGPDGATRKKDNFTVFTPTPEPEILAEPYLYGISWSAADPKVVTRLIADPGASFGKKPILTSVYTYNGEYAYQSIRFPFVGDGYVLRMMRTNGSHAPADERWWPTMIRAKLHGTEVVTNGTKGQSISFINDWQMSYAYSFSLVAMGWDEDTYRFAMSAIVNSNPILFTGSTKDQTIVQKVLPTSKPLGTDFSADGVTNGLYIYPLWRGALQYVRRCDFPPVPLTAPIPVICTSVNFGETWSTATIPELESYMASSYTTIAFDASKSIIVYLGNNKSMLIASFYHPRTGSVPSQPMTIAFVGENGGGYTRITWPADNWYPVLFNQPVLNAVLLTQNWIRSAQFSFGEGCMYLPVIQDNVFKIMLTRDYGATWSFSVEIPAQLRGIGSRETPGVNGNVNAMPDGFAGTIIKPYANENTKGEILFSYPDYEKKRIVFLRTDGTFEKFTRVGSARTDKNLLTTQPQPSADEDGVISHHADGINYTFTNYGGYVYPAFPREFDKP